MQLVEEHDLYMEMHLDNDKYLDRRTVMHPDKTGYMFKCCSSFNFLSAKQISSNLLIMAPSQVVAIFRY